MSVACADAIRWSRKTQLCHSRAAITTSSVPSMRTASQATVRFSSASTRSALPAVAQALSDMQRRLTGDDLATAIDRFAA
jgi:hypothetical protein